MKDKFDVAESIPLCPRCSVRLKPDEIGHRVCRKCATMEMIEIMGAGVLGLPESWFTPLPGAGKADMIRGTITIPFEIPAGDVGVTAAWDGSPASRDELCAEILNALSDTLPAGEFPSVDDAVLRRVRFLPVNDIDARIVLTAGPVRGNLRQIRDAALEDGERETDAESLSDASFWRKWGDDA